MLFEVMLESEDIDCFGNFNGMFIVLLVGGILGYVFNWLNG